MTKTIYILPFIALTTAQLHAQVNVDRVVAVVGNKVILQNELDEYTNTRSSTDGKDVFCTSLEEAMFAKLMSYQADADSLIVSNEQVEAELEARLRYMISNPEIGSLQKFEEQYGPATNFKNAWREMLHDQLKARKMQENITGSIKITPREIKQFFQSIPKEEMPFIGAATEAAQLVIIPEISFEEKERSKNQLTEIRNTLLAEPDRFCEMAVSSSDDKTSRGNCGDLNWLEKGLMPAEFEAQVFALSEGELSGVFETSEGFNLVKLHARRGNAYHASLILVRPKITPAALNAAAQKLESIYTEIKNETITFENAVIKYSQDEQTRYNGGKIFDPSTGETKLNNNQIDNQLFVTVDGMEPGEVSQPVMMTTDDGKKAIRIVKCISRTEPHVASLETDYPLIADAALNDKKNKTIAAWINSKTKETYVWIEEEKKDCAFDYSWIK